MFRREQAQKNTPKLKNHGDGLSLQFLSCSSKANLLTGMLQYRQGGVWYLQCTLWSSKSPWTSFRRQPFGHTILQNSHVLWCSSFSSCRPSQVHPSFTHLIFILLIMPSTIKLFSSSLATKGFAQMEQVH